MYTYHSRFIPERVAETSQISKTPAFYQNDLAMRNTADGTSGKPSPPSDHSAS
jgi:hypothetical protein